MIGISRNNDSSHRLLILLHRKFTNRLSKVNYSFANDSNSKMGCIGVCFYIHQTSFCFVNVDLGSNNFKDANTMSSEKKNDIITMLKKIHLNWKDLDFLKQFNNTICFGDADAAQQTMSPNSILTTFQSKQNVIFDAIPNDSLKLQNCYLKRVKRFWLFER